MRDAPSFSLENQLGKNAIVFGIDEVGRAPLAGPVVAACVFIPEHRRNEDIWLEVRDSKALSRKKRERLSPVIQSHSIWAIGSANIEEIEKLNIIQASLLAMKRAYVGCIKLTQSNNNPVALVDGNQPPSLPCKVKTVIKGDAKSVSIAASSIIAKVARDNLMIDLANSHPHFGWERNAGYPTKEHLEAINEHGITPHHRKTFAPVSNYLEFGNVNRQIKFAI